MHRFGDFLQIQPDSVVLMAADYSIEDQWKETVVYREGDRSYSFSAGWGVEPPVLYVPDEADWDDQVPDWLRGRRAEIVARLVRDSGHEVRSEATLREWRRSLTDGGHDRSGESPPRAEPDPGVGP